MTTVDGKDVPERTDERITCPVCKGKKTTVRHNPGFDSTGYGYDMCVACDGAGQVCTCPVCEGSKERQGAPCPACDARGWVSIAQWDKAVDAGHKRLMQEHGQEAKDKARDEQADIARLVAVHREAMNAVAVEWERFCKEHEMHTVDAGAFGRTLGGMTVAYLAAMEEEMGIDRHQVFAWFVNGMLHYMETRGDAKGVGVVAGQSAECRSGMLAMDGRAKVKKEEMN